MKIVSIEPKKSQTIRVDLDGQQCVIRILQRESFLYLDLTSNGVPLLQGVPCLYGNYLVRYNYLGFKGDLMFVDNEGNQDPKWDGLGSRHVLYYIEESDLV
jgi:hypothetical protein